MTDEEYQKRIRELHRYLPFLEHIIKRLKSEKGKFRDTQISKLQSIIEILKNAEEKNLRLQVLLKCEEVILKFCEKNQSSETMYKCMCQNPYDDKYQFGSHLNSADVCSVAQQQADLNLDNFNSPLENSLLARPVLIPTEKVQNCRHVLFADQNEFNDSSSSSNENCNVNQTLNWSLHDFTPHFPVDNHNSPLYPAQNSNLEICGHKISKPHPAVAPKRKQISKVAKRVVKEEDNMFGILLSTIDEQSMSKKKDRKKSKKKAVEISNEVRKDNKRDKTKTDIQLKYKKDEIIINKNLSYKEKKYLKINNDLKHESKYSKHNTKHKEYKKDFINKEQESKSKDETNIKDKDSINNGFDSKSKNKEVKSRDKETITKGKVLKHKENESKNKDDKKIKARMKSEEYNSKINKIISKLYDSKNKDKKSTSNNSKNKVQKSTIINKVDKSKRPLSKEEKQKTDENISKTHLSKIDAKKSVQIPFQTNFYNQNDLFGHNQGQFRLKPDEFKPEQGQFRTNHDQCHRNQDHRPDSDQSQENYDQFRRNKNKILIDAERNSGEFRQNPQFLNNNYPSWSKPDYHQNQPQEQNSSDFYANEDKNRDYFNSNVQWVNQTSSNENRREYQEEERSYSPGRFSNKDKEPWRSRLKDRFSKEDQRFPADKKSSPQRSKFEEKRAFQIEDNCENHRKMRLKEKRDGKTKIEGYVKNLRIPKICKADIEQEKKNAFEGRKCIKENKVAEIIEKSKEGQEESKQDDAKEKEVKIESSTLTEVTKISKTETEEKLNMFDKFMKHIIGTCDASFLTQYLKEGRRSNSKSEEETAKKENKQGERVTVEEISQTKQPEQQTSDKLQEEEENVIVSERIRNSRRKQRIYSSDSSFDIEEEIDKEGNKQVEKRKVEETSRTKEPEQKTSDKLQKEENVIITEKIRNTRRKQRIYSSDSSSDKEEEIAKEESKKAEKVTAEETSRIKEPEQQTFDKLQEENIIVSEKIRNTRRKQRIYSSDSSSEKEITKEEKKQAEKVTVDKTSGTKEPEQQTSDKLQEENIIVSERIRNIKGKQRIYFSDSSSEKEEEITKEEKKQAEKVTVEETSGTKEPEQQTSHKLQEENIIFSNKIRNIKRKHRIYSSDFSSEKEEENEEEIAKEEYRQAGKVTVEETSRTKEPEQQTSGKVQEGENIIVRERIRNIKRKQRIYSSDSSSEKEEKITKEEKKQAEKVTVETSGTKEPEQQTSDKLQEENIIVSKRIKNIKRKQRIYSSDSSSEKEEKITKEEKNQAEKVTVETSGTKEPEQQTSDKLHEENIIVSKRIRNIKRKQRIYSSDSSSEKEEENEEEIAKEEYKQAGKVTVEETSRTKEPEQQTSDKVQEEENAMFNEMIRNTRRKRRIYSGFSPEKPLAISGGISVKGKIIAKKLMKKSQDALKSLSEGDLTVTGNQHPEQEVYDILNNSKNNEKEKAYVISHDLRLAKHVTGRSPKKNLKSFTSQKDTLNKKEKREEINEITSEKSKLPQKRSRSSLPVFLEEKSFSYVKSSDEENSADGREKEKNKEMIFVEPKVSEVKPEKKRRGRPRKKIAEASVSFSIIESKTTETEKEEMIFAEPKISEEKPGKKRRGQPRKKIAESSVSSSTFESKTTATEKIEFETGKFVEKLKKKKLVKKRMNYWANGILKRYNCKKYGLDRSILSSQSTKISDLKPDIYYFLDNGNCFYCKLCDYKGKFIVHHYRTKHPESENLISRLNPYEAEKAKAESKLNKYVEIESFEEVENGKKRKTNFVCRFCNISLTTEVSTFVDHVCSHTGEYRYSCKLCPYFAIKKRTLGNHCYKIHPELKPITLTPIWPSPPNFRLMFGYLCKACNFTQILKKNVEKHINISHLEQNIEIIKISMSSESVTLNDIISSKNVETKLDENEKSIEKTRELEPIIENGTGMNVFVEPDVNSSREELIEEERFKTIEQILSSITSKRSVLQFINQLKNKFESILCEDDYENTYVDIENHQLEEVYSEELKNLKKELFPPQDFNLKSCSTIRLAETVSNYEDTSPTRIVNTCSLAGLESFETEKEDSQNSFEEDETTELSNKDVDVDVNPKTSHPGMGFLQIKDIRTLNEEEEHDLLSNLQNTSSKPVDSQNSQLNLQIIQPNLINVEKKVTNLPANKELSKYVSFKHTSTYKEQPTADNIVWYKEKNIFNEMLVYPKILEIYKCPLEFCSFSSGSQKEFKIHMTSHTWYPIRVCVYCQEIIKPENLVMHIDTIHSHCTLQCAFCFYRTISKKYLLYHQKYVHKQSCNTLVEGLFYQLNPTNTTQFIDIPPRNAIILPYKCIQDNCTQEFLLADDFMVHLHIYHKNNFMCAICDDRTYYVTAQNLIQHYIMHNIARYQCQYCICGTHNIDTMFMHYAQNHQHLKPICYVRQKKNENVSSKTLDDIILINMDSKSIEPKLNTQQLPEQSTTQQIINISSPTVTSTIPAEQNLFTAFVDTSPTTNVIIDGKDSEIINIDSTTKSSQIIEFVDLNKEEGHFSEPYVTLEHRNIESKNAIENAMETASVDNFEISHDLTKKGTNLIDNKLSIHSLKKDRDKNNFSVEAINEKDLGKEKGKCIIKSTPSSKKEKNKVKQDLRQIKCPEYGHSYRPMRQRLMNHFSKPIQCSHCNTCFNFPINLKNHHVQKHGDIPLIINKVPEFTKQINKTSGPMLHLNKDETYSTKTKLKRPSNSTELDEPQTKILVLDGKLDINPSIKRNVAKKSTLNQPKNLEFSFYGTKPCNINDYWNVTSEIDIMNKGMRINVVAMSHILNLSPTVQLVDLKKQISL